MLNFLKFLLDFGISGHFTQLSILYQFYQKCQLVSGGSLAQ